MGMGEPLCSCRLASEFCGVMGHDLFSPKRFVHSAGYLGRAYRSYNRLWHLPLGEVRRDGNCLLVRTKVLTPGLKSSLQTFNYLRPLT